MSSLFTESWVSGPQSTKFYTRTYSASAPCKAILIFLHGFGEHVGRHTHFHSLFHEHHVSVFAFDQRGFGRTALDKENSGSENSSYGRTSWQDQMEDIAWAVRHASKEFSGIPVFLMGHSMGGGEVLGFATLGEKSPHYSTVSCLSGIIATSPLIKQTFPAPKLLRWLGGKASSFAPYTLIPADVDPAQLSHDPDVGEAYLKDPLVRSSGSLRGLHDMLYKGEMLLESYYKDWPNNLPLYIIHGTDDKITSHAAAQNFYEKVVAKIKKIKLFEGGLHELHNEPNGVKEALLAEIMVLIDESLANVAPALTNSQYSKM